MSELSERPAFSLREAASVTGVSLSTIRRKHRAGAFENAVMSDGQWAIPVNDLLAAGLRVNAPGGAETNGHEPPPERATNDAELVQLRHDLEVERVRRQAAEQLADERLRSLDDQRLALRMLEASVHEKPARDHEQEKEQAPPRRWWKRAPA